MPAVPSMERKSWPSWKVWPADGHGLRLVIDFDFRRAADADLAHLPGHERRVRGDASARREDALGGDHAAQILRRSLDAHEQNLLALRGGGGRAVRVEINAPGGRAGTGGQAVGDRASRP